jgi:hypothetical protein
MGKAICHPVRRQQKMGNYLSFSGLSAYRVYPDPAATRHSPDRVIAALSGRIITQSWGSTVTGVACEWGLHPNADRWNNFIDSGIVVKCGFVFS